MAVSPRNAATARPKEAFLLEMLRTRCMYRVAKSESANSREATVAPHSMLCSGMADKVWAREIGPALPTGDWDWVAKQ